MKKIVGLTLIAIFCSSIVLAYPVSIKILTEDEIARLTDEQLMETYIDAIIEVEVARTFHQASGFQARDIKTFKQLLRYRIRLILEMQKRKIDIPDIEQK